MAHKGMAEMARLVWRVCGSKIVHLFSNRIDLKDYGLLITGHSLGAGTACLLTIHLHVEKVLPNRSIRCFAFAPPPTFCYPIRTDKAIMVDGSSLCIDDRIRQAMANIVSFIHDNDVVPLLSVSSIRRLARLMDAVDNETEHIWFWKRWRIFQEYDPIPSNIIQSFQHADGNHEITTTENNPKTEEFIMRIPSEVVIWCRKTFTGKFEPYICDPMKVAMGNIFVCPDMISDHLPEQYEDALDALVKP